MEPKYSLLPKDHHLLHKELERFTFFDPPTDPIALAHDLAEHMMYYGGIGLAANQIGLPYRAFAMMANPIIVMFNPILLDQSSEEIYLEESCLSIPGLVCKVKRPKSIKIRYTEPNGNTKTHKYTGMTARTIQHEMDHLDGILFTKRANPIHLEQAKKKLNKLLKEQRNGSIDK